MKSDSTQKSKSPAGLLARMVAAANHDFCPGANRYVYWLKQPVGWVVGCAFCSLLIGLFIGPQGYVLFFSALGVLALGAIWPWLSLKRVRCRIRFEHSRIHESETADVIVEIENRWPMPVFGLKIEGSFLQSLRTESDRIAVAFRRIAAWSRTEFRWSVSPERRGLLPAEIPRLVTGFPFGLYEAARPVEVISSTLVWPRTDLVVPKFDRTGQQASLLGDLGDFAGTVSETIGIREFRPGDLIRNIHWSKSARYNQLMVRERQSPCQYPVRVVVDLDPTRQHHAGDNSSFEWSIRLAASLCRELHAKRQPIELHCWGLPDDLSRPLTNARGLTPILDFLAQLPGESSLSSIAPAHRPVLVPRTQDARHLGCFIGSKSGNFKTDELSGFHRILVGPDGTFEYWPGKSDRGLRAAMVAASRSFDDGLTVRGKVLESGLKQELLP